MQNNSDLAPQRRVAAEALLSAMGYHDAPWAALAGGANNRVWRVDGTPPCLLKAYHRHPDDPRERLAHEFAFAQFAWKVGVRALPRPIAADADHDIALYEFVVGRKLETDEFDRGVVWQAVDFFQELNRHRHRKEAQELPAGSEACFSLADHARCLERRLGMLTTVDSSAGIDARARSLVHEQLHPMAMRVIESAKHQASQSKLAWDVPLPAEARCVSPSDFGFHNALLKPDGRVIFLDFEYAGWDDPARMVADFFCQPRFRVPAELFDPFARAIAASFPDPDAMVERMSVLWPVYRAKWCCIMLNDFLPQGSRRRNFADQQHDETSRKARQLVMAAAAIDSLSHGLAA